jgi:hypothetical protein
MTDVPHSTNPRTLWISLDPVLEASPFGEGFRLGALCSRETDEEPERVGTAEAASILGVKPRKLQAMSQRNEIPGAAKIGRQWTYDQAKLRQFIERQEQVTACHGSAMRPRPRRLFAQGPARAHVGQDDRDVSHCRLSDVGRNSGREIWG